MKFWQADIVEKSLSIYLRGKKWGRGLKTTFFWLVPLQIRENVATEKSVKSHLWKENNCTLHAVSNRTRKNGFFLNGNTQSYCYLLTEVFIQVVIPIKVPITSRKRRLLQIIQQSGRAKRYTYLYVSLLRPPLPKACRRGGRQFFTCGSFS